MWGGVKFFFGGGRIHADSGFFKVVQKYFGKSWWPMWSTEASIDVYFLIFIQTLQRS
jgi:hypothetical protein